MRLARKISRLPGVHWLKRTVLLPEGKGSWLFNRDVVRWIWQPDLRSQLPWSLRAFGGFCRAQSPFLPVVLGGQRLLEAAISYHRRRGLRAIRLHKDGVVVHLDPLDPRMLQVPNEVFGDSHVADLISSVLRPGDTFIDIGANHGSFSILAGHRVGPSGRVLAFEPQPRLAALIRVSLAAIDDLDFEVLETVCGDEVDMITFFRPLESSGSAGVMADFSADRPHEVLEAPQRRLDDLTADLNLPGDIVMKIDVEGAEMAVLAGASGFLRQHQPTILMEINPAAMAAAGTSSDQFKAWLSEHGYSRVRDASFEEHPLDALDAKHHRNLLFLP